MAIRIITVILALGFVWPVLAEDEELEEKPLYELGVMAGAFNIPDYPGSDRSRTRYLGLPYFRYRGKFLRADEEGGLRGQFLDKERIEIDVSVAAAFPADSEENKARAGMPDLDWIGEVGPRVTVHMFSHSIWGELDLHLPLRWVFSTDFTRVDNRGFLFPPTLDYSYYGLFHPDLDFFIRAGLLFGTRELTKYFYEVSAEYATVDRPQYRAKEGFMGTRLGFAIRQQFHKNLWMFAGVGYDTYTGSDNADSPLLIAKTTATYVMGFGWTFHESKQMAESFW